MKEEENANKKPLDYVSFFFLHDFISTVLNYNITHTTTTKILTLCLFFVYYYSTVLLIQNYLFNNLIFVLMLRVLTYFYIFSSFKDFMTNFNKYYWRSRYFNSIITKPEPKPKIGLRCIDNKNLTLNRRYLNKRSSQTQKQTLLKLKKVNFDF